jgi:hypothetical protein
MVKPDILGGLHELARGIAALQPKSLDDRTTVLELHASLRELEKALVSHYVLLTPT